jgi:hypothetical protein
MNGRRRIARRIGAAICIDGPPPLFRDSEN